MKQPPTKSNTFDYLTWLHQLELLSPGLSTLGLIEQGNCFVFTDEAIHTYNGEVSCRCPNTTAIRGAVPSEPLLAVLRAWAAEKIKRSVEVSCLNGTLMLVAKGRTKETVKIVRERKILLPIPKTTSPQEWHKLPETWAEMVKEVSYCASKDESDVTFTCVHIHPKYVEATDNYQVARYSVKTGLSEPVLVRANIIRKILATVPLTEIATSKSWLHLRSPALGIETLIRYDISEYPPLGAFLKVEGHEATLPKRSVVENANLASIFTKVPDEANIVKVTLDSDYATIVGTGPLGSHRGRMRAKYAGPRVAFNVNPELLASLVKRSRQCIVGKTKLKIQADGLTYITCTEVTSET